MEARDTAGTCPPALPAPPEPTCSHIPPNTCLQSLSGVPEFSHVTPSTLVQTRSCPGLMLWLSACPLPKQEGFSLKKSPRIPCTFPLSGSFPLPWRCRCNTLYGLRGRMCPGPHTPLQPHVTFPAPSSRITLTPAPFRSLGATCFMLLGPCSVCSLPQLCHTYFMFSFFLCISYHR